MEPSAKPNVEIGPWVSEGWKMFTAHWATWVKMVAIAVLPALLPGVIAMVGYIGAIGSVVGAIPQPGPYGYVQAAPPSPPMWAFALLGIGGLGAIVGGLLSTYFVVGLWKAALKQARGGAPEMSDLKGNMPLWGRVLGASIVVGLLTLAGMMCCYIPGFIVMGWYMFTVPLIIDKGLTIGDAMAKSKEMTSQSLLMFILFAFVVGLLSQLGIYLCVVGIFASMPLLYTIHAVAYRAMYDGVGPAAWPVATGPSPV